MVPVVFFLHSKTHNTILWKTFADFLLMSFITYFHQKLLEWNYEDSWDFSWTAVRNILIRKTSHKTKFLCSSNQIVLPSELVKRGRDAQYYGVTYFYIHISSSLPVTAHLSRYLLPNILFLAQHMVVGRELFAMVQHKKVLFVWRQKKWAGWPHLKASSQWCGTSQNQILSMSSA